MPELSEERKDEIRSKFSAIEMAIYNDKRDTARYRLLRTMMGSEWAEQVGANEELDSALDEMLNKKDLPW